LKLAFHSEARRDRRDATLWYRAESLDLAKRFAAEVATTLKRISKSPLQFPATDDDCRAALLMNLPYRIIFYYTPALIVIIAIAHTSRHPDYWRNRLDPS
jgi:plasmid stabilization system protein ParE